METQVSLTPVETAKLENLEIVIEAGMKSFLDVGNALSQIRDEELYRASHMRFQDYLRERWDMEERRAYQLMDATAVVNDIVDKNCTVVQPANERQARPLTKLPQTDRASAWKEAVETAPNGKVTSAHVEQVVKNRLPEYEPEDDDQKSNGRPKRYEDKNDKADVAAKELRDEFIARLDKITDGGVYTLKTIAKAFGAKDDRSAQVFIMQCEVSPSVKVHRTYGKKALTQYSFEKTECVSAHARIRQLAQQIARDGTGNVKAAAEKILTLLGG